MNPWPITRLRELARERAAHRVYEDPVWSGTGRHFKVGDDFVDPGPVCEELRTIDFERIATAAAADLGLDLEDDLEDWWDGFGTSGYPETDPARWMLPPSEAQQFTELVGRLLHQLAGRPDEAYHVAPRPICYREVARVREEVARLLERRLIDVYQARLTEVQTALSTMVASGSTPSESGPTAALNQVGAALDAVEDWLAAGAEPTAPVVGAEDAVLREDEGDRHVRS